MLLGRGGLRALLGCRPMGWVLWMRVEAEDLFGGGDGEEDQRMALGLALVEVGVQDQMYGLFGGDLEGLEEVVEVVVAFL